MVMVSVPPIDWDAWGDWKLCPSVTGARRYIYRYYENDVGVCHWLKEMGDTSNKYRYTVYFKGRALFDTYIEAKCCGGYDRCPIPLRYIPMKPCREYLREATIEEAHRRWVLFITTITALQEGV